MKDLPLNQLIPEIHPSQYPLLYDWISKEIIGEDLPMEQPFDEDMDKVELLGNRLFRKGANWTKAAQREALQTKLGLNKEHQ